MNKEMQEDRSCPVCGSGMVRDVRPFEVMFGGRSMTVGAPGDYCTNCGEAVFAGRDMLEADGALHRLKAQSLGLLLPEEIRKIRKKLGLTQAEASLVLGGGPNAFSRYESGTGLPSQAVSNLMRLLDADPGGLAVLTSREGSDARNLHESDDRTGFGTRGSTTRQQKREAVITR